MTPASDCPASYCPVSHRPDERLDEFLLAAADSAPERPAVVEFVRDNEIRVVTFGQLRQLATDYGATLSGLGLDIGERVVVDADNSASAIAMLLACSATGLAFVPVCPETPTQRVQWIVDAVEPAAYLWAHQDRTHATSGRGLELGADTGVGCFGAAGLVLDRPPGNRTRHRTEIVETDTAYIIFTSGSTGCPKGVVMSHRAVVSFYRGMLSQHLVSANDRVASTAPLQFDFSLLDVGLAFGSGAAVAPVPRGLLRWPTRFLRVLRDTGTSHVNGVPSIWRQVLRREPDRLAELSTLRGILYCGEEFPLSELRRLQQLRPGTRIVNCYGSTESMACSFADVPEPLPAGLDRLSIGHGHAGAEMMLVDEQGQVISDRDVVGEIYLRSPALFSGYWDDPVASRAALVADPVEPRSGQLVLRTGDLAYRGHDGELRFRGRADAQVQIRGNRVELGEIERRLLAFPGIADAAALVIGEPDDDPQVAAVVVPTAGLATVPQAELAAFCAAALPSYMVPGRIQKIDEIPTTQNGKVDRGTLAERLRGPAQPMYAPRTHDVSTH